MKYWKECLSGVVLLAGMSLLPLESYGQEQQNDAPPKPAAIAFPPIEVGDDQEANLPPDALQPDDRPVTGFQQLTIGTPPERHSYWIPGISYTNFIQSNALTRGGGKNWNSTSYVTGNLSLLKNWSGSQLALNYSGGGSFSSDSRLENGQFEQLGAVQTFNWRRWQLTILDQFSYTPLSQFGFGAGANLANPGTGGPLVPSQPGLQNPYNPSQSVFAAVGPRYSNAGGVQINYMFTPRSSITLGGTFGILRFTQQGNIENNSVVLSAGYNYQISKTDWAGLQYRFSAYRYLDNSQAIGDQVVQAVYGKKITRHLALQLSGGPEITDFRVPASTGGKTRYVTGSGAANLTYAFLSGTIGVSYTHGVNNGSGVFVGATSDQITGNAARKLSRLWTGSANLGYARNRGVQTLAAAGIGARGQSYNSLYVGATLTRPLGRNTNFSLGYTGSIASSNHGVCVGLNCGTNFTTHQINLGFSWNARPFVLH